MSSLLGCNNRTGGDEHIGRVTKAREKKQGMPVKR